MQQQQQPSPQPERKRGMSFVYTLIIVGVVLLVLGTGAIVFGGPLVGQFFGQQVEKTVEDQVEKQIAAQKERLGDLATNVPSEAQKQLEKTVAEELPAAIEALPTGELALTEDQANAYLKSRPEQFEPLENATVHFVPDQVQIDMESMGMQSQATFGLAAEDGRIVIVDPSLSGPLGIVVSFEDLAVSLEEQINEQFNTKGRSIESVRVEEDRIVVAIE